MLTEIQTQLFLDVLEQTARLEKYPEQAYWVYRSLLLHLHTLQIKLIEQKQEDENLSLILTLFFQQFSQWQAKNISTTAQIELYNLAIELADLHEPLAIAYVPLFTNILYPLKSTSLLSTEINVSKTLNEVHKESLDKLVDLLKAYRLALQNTKDQTERLKLAENLEHLELNALQQIRMYHQLITQDGFRLFEKELKKTACVDGFYERYLSYCNTFFFKSQWQTYREKLTIILNDTRKLSAGQPIFVLQCSLTQQYQKHISYLLEDAYLLMGSPPCDWTLLVTGSAGRQEMLPYSDVECIILIKEDSPSIRAYFEGLFRLLDIQIGLSGYYVEGFRLDPGINPFADVKFIQHPSTIEKLLKERLLNLEGILDNNTWLLQLQWFYGDKSLFSSYQQALKSVLRDIPILQDGAHYRLVNNLKEYKKTNHTTLSSSSLKLLLKEGLYFPLHALGLYHGIIKPNTQTLLEELTKQKILPAYFTKQLLGAISDIQSWLMHLQLGTTIETLPSTKIDLNTRWHMLTTGLIPIFHAWLRGYSRILLLKENEKLPSNEEFDPTAIYLIPYNNKIEIHWKVGKIKTSSITDKMKCNEIVNFFKDRKNAIIEKSETKACEEIALLCGFTRLKQSPINSGFDLTEFPPHTLYEHILPWLQDAILNEVPNEVLEQWYVQNDLELNRPLIFLKAFSSFKNYKPAQILFSLLGNYPNSQGIRPYSEQCYKALQWPKSLEALAECSMNPQAFSELRKEKKDSYLKQGVLEFAHNPKVFVLHPKVSSQLLKNGTFIAEKINGSRHYVRHIQHDNVDIHIKCSPNDSLDLAVQALYKLITGKYTPMAMARLITNKQDVPVLISYTMGQQKDNLNYVLQHNSKRLEKLDLRDFSLNILFSLIANNGDDKPGNFMVRSVIVEERSYEQLVNIDTDPFMPPVIQETRKTLLGTKELIIKPGVKSILLCMEEMKQEINARARDEFLKLNGGELLKEWLVLLQQYDREHRQRFPEELLNEWQNRGDQSTTLLIALVEDQFPKDQAIRPGLITTLFQKIQRLQSYLIDYPKATHWELLRFIEPLLADFYEKAWQAHKTPLERYNKIHDGEFVSIKYTLPSEDTLSKDTIVKEHLTPFSKKDIDKYRYDKIPKQEELLVLQKHSPQKALERLNAIIKEISEQRNELLSQLQEVGKKNANLIESAKLIASINKKIIHWLADDKEYLLQLLSDKKVPITIEVQRLFWRVLQNNAYRKLYFKNCDITDSELVAFLKNSPELLVLHLPGCEKLTDQTLRNIEIYCKQLQQLILDDTTISYFTSWSGYYALKFPQLKYLSVQNCKELIQILMDAPKLENLIANDAINLIRAETKSQHLKQLQLKSTKVEQEALHEVMSDTQHLETVTLDNPYVKQLMNSMSSHLKVIVFYNDGVAIADPFLTKCNLDLNPLTLVQESSFITKLIRGKKYIAIDELVYTLQFWNCSSLGGPILEKIAHGADILLHFHSLLNFNDADFYNIRASISKMKNATSSNPVIGLVGTDSELVIQEKIQLDHEMWSSFAKEIGALGYMQYSAISFHNVEKFFQLLISSCREVQRHEIFDEIFRPATTKTIDTDSINTLKKDYDHDFTDNIFKTSVKEDFETGKTNEFIKFLNAEKHPIVTRLGQSNQHQCLVEERSEIIHFVSNDVVEGSTIANIDKSILLENEKIKKIKSWLDELSSSFYYQRARIFCTYTLYQNAIKDCERAIQLNKKAGEYYLLRAECYYLISELTLAKVDFKKSIELSAKETDCLAGIFELEDKQYLKSIEYFTIPIQNETSKFIDAYINRAYVHYLLNNFDHALLDINEAIKQIEYKKITIPKELSFFKGMVCLAKKNLENAFFYYDKASKTASEKKIVLLLHADFKKNLLQLNDYHKKTLIELVSSNITLPLNCHIEYIKLCYQQAQYKNALERLEKLTESFPKETMVYCYQGLIFLAQGKFMRAEQSLQKALECDATDVNVRLNLAYCQLQLKQPREAFEQLEILQNTYSNLKKSAIFLFTLGLAYEKLGKLEQAIVILQEAVKLKLDLTSASNQIEISKPHQREFLNIEMYVKELQTRAPLQSVNGQRLSIFKKVEGEKDDLNTEKRKMGLEKK